MKNGVNIVKDDGYPGTFSLMNFSSKSHKQAFNVGPPDPGVDRMKENIFQGISLFAVHVLWWHSMIPLSRVGKFNVKHIRIIFDVLLGGPCPPLL